MRGCEGSKVFDLLTVILCQILRGWMMIVKQWDVRQWAMKIRMLMDECRRNCTVVADGRFDLRVYVCFRSCLRVFCLWSNAIFIQFCSIPFQQQHHLHKSTIDPHYNVHQKIRCDKFKFLLTSQSYCHNKLDWQPDPALLRLGWLNCKIEFPLLGETVLVNFEKHTGDSWAERLCEGAAGLWLQCPSW